MAVRYYTPHNTYWVNMPTGVNEQVACQARHSAPADTSRQSSAFAIRVEAVEGRLDFKWKRQKIKADHPPPREERGSLIRGCLFSQQPEAYSHWCSHWALVGTSLRTGGLVTGEVTGPQLVLPFAREQAYSH